MFVTGFLGGAGLTGFLCTHGRQDVLTAAIGRPDHLGRVRTVGVSVMIEQFFRLAPRTSRTSSSMAPEDLEQLKESIIEKVT